MQTRTIMTLEQLLENLAAAIERNATNQRLGEYARMRHRQRIVADARKLLRDIASHPNA